MKNLVVGLGILMGVVGIGCDQAPTWTGGDIDTGTGETFSTDEDTSGSQIPCAEESECCQDGFVVNEGEVCNLENLCFPSACVKGICMKGDEKECAEGECAPSTGECCSGCVFDGECYLDAADLGDNSCLVCDAGTHEFVPTEDDTPCNGDDPCMAGDLCRAGVCREGTQPKCTEDGIACNGLKTCEAGECITIPPTGEDECIEPMVCNGATGTCSTHCLTIQCKIDNTCYENGDTPDELGCMVCDPARELNDWSPSDSQCEDAYVCTEDICNPSTGMCEFPVISSDCLIGGQCIPNGEVDPENECQECNHALKPEGWSSRTEQLCDDDDNDPYTEGRCNSTGICEGTDFCELATCWEVAPTGYDLQQCWDGSGYAVPCSYFGGGRDHSAGCAEPYPTWCGQDGQYADNTVVGDRFTVEGAAVPDRVTGLAWQYQDAVDKTWDQAMDECQDPWRLPTVHELATLIKYGTSDPASEFPDTASSEFWSASEDVNSSVFCAGGPIASGDCPVDRCTDLADVDFFAATGAPHPLGAGVSGTGCETMFGTGAPAGIELWANVTECEESCASCYQHCPKNAAWHVGFNRGKVNIDSKGNPRAVRCVSGEPFGVNEGPLPRFAVSETEGDDVIVDRHYGLEWQAQVRLRAAPWYLALDDCETSTYANQDDWRLPNVNELRSLVDYSQDDSGHAVHPDIAGDFTTETDFWSSSTPVNLATHAWFVDFVTGVVEYGNKDGQGAVRCVRGGP